ncbi:MAG: hypothetical protein ACRDG7_08685 [Candidatus Limnocylindria bacterium]
MLATLVIDVRELVVAKRVALPRAQIGHELLFSLQVVRQAVASRVPVGSV